MKYRIVFAALAVSVAVGAGCLVAPGERAGSGVVAITCGATQAAFNGVCHDRCNTTADCSGADSCSEVAAGVLVCATTSNCAYEGDDTACARMGFSGYSAYGGYGGGSQCGGNAVWISVPTALHGGVRCGQPHSVHRCQAVGGSCQLVEQVVSDVAE